MGLERGRHFYGSAEGSVVIDRGHILGRMLNAQPLPDTRIETEGQVFPTPSFKANRRNLIRLCRPEAEERCTVK